MLQEVGWYTAAVVESTTVDTVLDGLHNMMGCRMTRVWQLGVSDTRIFVPVGVKEEAHLYLAMLGRFGLELWIACEKNAMLLRQVGMENDVLQSPRGDVLCPKAFPREVMVSNRLYQHLRWVEGKPALR